MIFSSIDLVSLYFRTYTFCSIRRVYPEDSVCYSFSMKGGGGGKDGLPRFFFKNTECLFIKLIIFYVTKITREDKYRNERGIQFISSKYNLL